MARRYMRRFVVLCLPVVFSLAIVISGCGGGNSARSFTSTQTPTSTPAPTTPNEWAWMSGSTTKDAVGVYGTMDAASASNVPGARSGSVGWTDQSGSFWLFGGWGFA